MQPEDSDHERCTKNRFWTRSGESSCTNLACKPLAKPGAADVDTWEASGEKVCLLDGVLVMHAFGGMLEKIMLSPGMK